MMAHGTWHMAPALLLSLSSLLLQSQSTVDGLAGKYPVGTRTVPGMVDGWKDLSRTHADRARQCERYDLFANK
jgi:hypothetical protein